MKLPMPKQFKQHRLIPPIKNCLYNFSIILILCTQADAGYEAYTVYVQQSLHQFTNSLSERNGSLLVSSVVSTACAIGT